MISSPINPFGVSLLSLATGTHGYPKSASVQGDCVAYLSQLHSKLARFPNKYSPVSIIAENEDEFCEKREQIVAEIMARSRTVIFCMGKCVCGGMELINEFIYHFVKSRTCSGQLYRSAIARATRVKI